MFFRHHKLLLCLSTVIAAGNAAPAFAQDGDIIVTARRVEERLQDVPISISVVSQKEILDRNVNNGTELSTYTPSLQSNPQYGPESASFSIRGFVQDTGTVPSVGVYFADVVAPRGAASFAAGDGAGPGYFYDLQNVQILKGPQGTLFGRNTTGGAVLLVPQKPKGAFGGYVEGSLGDYDLVRVQGAINLPIGDRARLRVAADRQTRDGYLRNISGIGPRDFADTDYFAGRVSLVLDLTPDLENYTIASYVRSHTAGITARTVGCPAGSGYQPQCLQQIATEAATGDFYVVSNANEGARQLLDQWQVINTTTWRASDTLTVKNIVSYAELYNEIAFSAFGAAFPDGTGRLYSISNLSPVNGPTNHQSTFTEELQFQGSLLDSRLTWQAGGYLELAEPLDTVSNGTASFLSCTDQPARQCVGAPFFRAGGAGTLNIIYSQAHYRNLGVYAQATYKLTDQLNFTGGIRYTDDISRATTNAFSYFSALGGPVILPNGTPTRGLPATPRCSLSAVTTLPDCPFSSRQHSKAPTWVVDLDWKPTDDVLLYIKYSRGYRQGLVNPRAYAPNDKFDQEKVDTYEAGAKASWRGSVPGTLNFAAFYNDFTNQQYNITFQGISGAFLGVIQPATCACAKSRLYGAEVEGSISPFEGLRLSGGYTYLNTKITDFRTPTYPFDSAPNTSFRIVDSTQENTVGRPLIQTPRHKAVATLAYTLPLPESVGRITPSATFAYSASYYSRPQDTTVISPYSILNLNLSWESVAGRPIDLSAFVTNVGDRHYYVAKSDIGGQISAVLGAPRMWGVRARYRFGGDAN